MESNMLMSFQSGKKLGDELELCLHKLGDKLELLLNGGDKKKANQYAKGLSM